MDNQPCANASIADFPRILQQQLPLIDVRAPVEFHQGAIAGAINLPLMDDQQRAAVGTCYKQQGRQAALALGHQLVSGALRQQRLADWRNACQHNPQGYIYCARGGMRSHIVQRWLHESGIDYPLISGGYKALRQYLLCCLARLAQQPMLLIGGCTGSGKTRLLRQQPCGVDLEQLACHRGSSFGRTAQPQPAQASFENQLVARMLAICAHTANPRWLLEDEGRTIGGICLPESLRQPMSLAPLAVVDEPFERRVQRLCEEYFIDSLADLQALHGEQDGWQQYADWLRQGLFTIRRRLGLERYQQCQQHLERALAIQQQSACIDGHLGWLEPLLRHYYDPMYRYQLEQKSASIIFRGDYQQVAQWLAEHQHNAS